MNLITVIVVAVLAWMVYMYMQSYDAIAKELREIRLKCVQSAPDIALPTEHPMTTMRRQMETGLRAIKQSTSSRARPSLARNKQLRQQSQNLI